MNAPMRLLGGSGAAATLRSAPDGFPLLRVKIKQNLDSVPQRSALVPGLTSCTSHHGPLVPISGTRKRAIERTFKNRQFEPMTLEILHIRLNSLNCLANFITNIFFN